jgi:hypothetical protein
MDKMGGKCSTYGLRIAQILVGKSEGKRQLERSRHRREDNIKMDFNFYLRR